MTPVLVLQIKISWENRELVFIFFLKTKCWITVCLKWPKTKTTKHISTNYSVIFLSRKSFENLKFDLKIPISEFLSLPYPFFFFLSSSYPLRSFYSLFLIFPLAKNLCWSCFWKNVYKITFPIQKMLISFLLLQYSHRTISFPENIHLKNYLSIMRHIPLILKCYSQLKLTIFKLMGT